MSWFNEMYKALNSHHRLEQINHKSTLISDFERGSWYVRNPKSEVILWEISNVLLKIERRAWKFATYTRDRICF